jgi:hypothetical protein
MSQGFGNESPRPHSATPHQKISRFLVLIDAGGVKVTRLFLEDRTQVAEFDAGAEETALMTRGLTPSAGASGSEWDASLGGLGASERAAAEVYMLDV